MRKKSLILLIAIASVSLAQYKISGRVFDLTTGEALISANVFIPELNVGTTTDFNGEFVINVGKSSFRMRVSYVGYKTIDTLITISGETKLNIGLQAEAIKFKEVEVSGSAVNDNVSLKGFMASKQISTGIFDGLSYEQIKLTTASTSSELMGKVVGVSIRQDKFVNVRGVDERYNIAVLNGSFLPSPEADKKAFTFDLIPAGLVQSIKVVKTFSPDLPGNFSGGFVDIKTIEFPDSTVNSANLSFSGIPDATFKKFFVYGMNRLSFFGASDKISGLPPSLPEDITRVPIEQRNIYAKDIKNLWNRNSLYSLPNFRTNFLSVGKIFWGRFSYSVGVIYESYSHKKDFEVYEYEGDWSKRFEFSGNRILREVRFANSLELKAKFSNQVVGVRGLLVGLFEDESAQMRGFQYTDQGAEQIHMAIKFNQRNLYFGQIYGENNFGDVNFKWQGSISSVLNIEPDTRRLVYGRDMNNPDAKFTVILGPQANLKNGGILSSNLKDEVREIRTSVKLPIFGFNLKTGFDFWETRRNFKFRLIGVVVNLNGVTDWKMYYLPADSIFIPENFKRNGFSLDEYKAGTNKYKAYDKNVSTYLLLDLPFKMKNQVFNLSTGFRIEKVNQNIYTRDFADVRDVVIAKRYFEVLPSVELKCSPTYMMNIKLSYSQTINKPELREISPFAYFDFYTQTSVRGDSALKRALIFNYDLRFELFGLSDDMISVGIFHKHINSPIEKVIVSGSALGSERTFKNARFANVFGIEFEFVKNIWWVKIIGNLSLIKSRVDVERTEGTIERKGRSLQGQAPYLVNVLIVYEKPNSKFNSSLSFNLTGPRVYDVATQYSSDIIEQVRYQVDLKFAYELSKNLTLNLTGKNITAKPVVLKQGDYVYQKISTIMSISFGLNVKF
ncbi:TonB-dependent receptor [Candidatus Kryptobacter tengchongensis]|uniref:TonB dependent receptor n=1 Tax=Kryptobacter tengchongensis TaxID=1643429 RepID=A0A656D803_KRYT1|nr:TonB-dependent receptor [Candidatus Kryptobacter tengchongensis]CUT00970.1 TonB dependent receptor [Candidatus Kryptobacter tengchongensis]